MQLRTDHADALHLQVNYHRRLALAFGVDRWRQLGPGSRCGQGSIQPCPQRQQ
jgi:hypothetical protein